MNAVSKTKVTVYLLAGLFLACKEAGVAAGSDPEDGGTCNMDSPAFNLPRVKDAVIQEAASIAGVTASDFKWFGGQRWYWVTGFLMGQGNRRARMSHAATKALKAAAVELLPEMSVCEYCQAD